VWGEENTRQETTMSGWKRIHPTELEKVYPGGVRLRLVNLTAEVGKRRWNLGVVREDGRVEWFESGSTRAEVEAFADAAAAEELSQKS
jgi:hypothetical protein